ncbi:MAG TPA: hypothetical protein VN238_05730, partial [Solirubrobacteraceae bacterium]|nr:hypothetical protein [Solirubrobacteraceae bacterium]
AGASAALLPAAAPAAQPLPGGRVIELVSPPDTNNESARPGGGLASNPLIFPDGRLAMSQLFTAAFPETGNGWGAVWQSVRDPLGWTRTNLESPPDEQLGRWHFDILAGTPDLSRMLLQRITMRSVFADQQGVRFRGPSVLEVREASGARTTIASIPYPESMENRPALEVSGASEDLRTVVFTSTARLTDDPLEPNANQVYLWRDGRLELAGAAPGGPEIACGGIASSRDGSTRTVSADGSVVYLQFSARPVAGSQCGDRHIHVRVGDRIWQVDAPEPGVTAGTQGQGPSLIGTGPDGRTSYFRSFTALTADDVNGVGDLYRADLPAGGGDPTVTCVTCAWGGTAGVDVPDSEAGQVSADGSTVLFRAAGVIDGQGSPAGTGHYNLFALRDGRIRLVVDASAQVPGLGNRENVNLTPDGRHVLFATRTDLTNAGTAGTSQLYRAALGADGTYGVTCVSCDPGGAPPTADAVWSGNNLNAFISDDGRTVSFASVDALTPTAVAGVRNLYVWEDGELGLIHTGLTRNEPAPLGVSPDGDDVYFDAYGALTTETAQTTDSIYDARRGGGFPTPVLPPAPCSGDGCRGAQTPQPTPPAVATVSFGGGDDAPAPKAGKVRVLRPKAKGQSVRVDVQAPAAGRLSVTGERVRSLSRTVTKAGSARMAVQLTSDARKILTRRKRVKVALKVTFRPAGGGAASSARLTVTVKR